MNGVLRYFCLAAVVTSIFSSCKKDKDETDPFINSSWKIAMQDDNPASNPPGEFGEDGPNTYYPWLDCQHDDSFTFGEDGQLRVNHGSAHCPGAYSLWLSLVVVPYEYDRQKKEITFRGERFIIGEITAQRLKLYQAVPAATGMGYMVYLFRR